MAGPHKPGRPATPEPPPGLVFVAQTLANPALARVGLTTTHDGRWALMAGVHAGMSTPIPAVEQAAQRFPVVYVEVPGEPPVARPAYPSLGE